MLWSLLLFAPLHRGSAAYKLTLIAMQGEQAPGTSLNFLSFNMLSLSADGRVSFQGELSGSPLNADFGLWTGDEHGLSLIAREGAPLPERPSPPPMTGIFSSPFQEVFIGDDGAVLYRVSTIDSDNHDALVRWSAGTSHVLLTADAQASGAPAGVKYGRIAVGQFRPANGQFLFPTTLTGTGVTADNAGAIFLGDQNGFSLAVRDQTTPDGAVGLLVSTTSYPALSSAGKIAISGFSQVAGGLKRTIYYGAPGMLDLVAQQGDGYDLLSRASVNGSGVTVFDSTLGGTNRALFSGAAGDVQRVLGVGDPTPDETGVTFQEGSNGLLADLFQIKDAGVIATNVHIAGTGLNPIKANGLYMGARDDLHLVARTGQQAAGFPAGKKYGEGAFAAQLNEAGRIAFLAYVAGITVDRDDFAGLWIGTPGHVNLVAGPGQVLDLGSRGIKTIASVGATIAVGTTLQNGSARTFNEAGQVVFVARFTDGSLALFRADEIANPNELTVTVSGLGSVTRGFAGTSTRVVGRAYTVVAAPAAGYIFTGWTGDIASPNPRLTFKMTPGLALTATFIPNPYLALAGTYTTIMDLPGAIPAGTITTTVSGAGALSGSLLLGSTRYVLRGKLAIDGTYTQVIPRRNQPALTVHLTFTGTGGIPTLTAGTADDTATTFSVEVDAALARRLPTGLTRGNFTMRVPASNTASDPRGDGYATVSLSPTGALHFAGKLGDGTPLITNTQIRQDSSTKLGVRLYRAPNGYIKGRLLFETQPESDASGTFSWLKPQQTTPGTQLYPSGFVTSVSALLTRYTAPLAGQHVFTHPAPTSATVLVSFADGDVASFSHLVHLNAADKVTSIDGLATGEKMDLTFTRATGLFTGHFQLPGAPRATAFSGAILRHPAQNRGDGVFLGTTKTGSVHLVPQ